MSNEQNGKPRHAKHLAANPADATFRFAVQNGAKQEQPAPRHGHEAMHNQNDAEQNLTHANKGTTDKNPDVASPSGPTNEGAAQVGTTHEVSPTAIPNELHKTEEHDLQLDQEATRLISPENDPEATRLVRPEELPKVDPEATRLVSPDDLPTIDPQATRPVSAEDLPIEDAGATRLVQPDEMARAASVPLDAASPAPGAMTSDEATHLMDLPSPADPPVLGDSEATHLMSPDDETDEVLFPEHDEITQTEPAAGTQDPTNPSGVRLAKNEIAAIPMQHSDYTNDAATPYISMRQAQKTPEEHRHTRKVVAVLVCVVILLGLGGVCYAFYHSFMTNTQTQDVPQYNTATIQSGEFVDSIDNSSVLRPVQSRDVVPQVSGTIASINVADGDQVSKGDTLFTLANQTITDEATKAKAAVDSAQQEVDSKTKDQTDAQQELDEASKTVSDTQASIEQLLGVDSGTLSAIATQEQAESDASNPSDTLKALQQTVSDAEERLSEDDKSKLNELQTQLQSASDKVTEAQAKVDSAKAALDTANENLTTLKSASQKAADQVSKLTVTAPFAGTVSNLSDSATQDAEVTGSTVLCTVSDVSQFVVVASVPDSKISQVAVGQTARLTFPDLPDLGTVEASVTNIGSTPTQTGDTTTYPVTITITNPDSSLTTGTTVKSSIILQSIPDSLIVPIETVQTDDDGNTYLDVLLDPTRGIHTSIQVTVKATSDTQAAVESPNIQADTQVIIPDNTSE